MTESKKKETLSALGILNKQLGTYVKQHDQFSSQLQGVSGAIYGIQEAIKEITNPTPEPEVPPVPPAPTVPNPEVVKPELNEEVEPISGDILQESAPVLEEVI